MSYNQFQLTEADVDRIKAKNARKSIRAYIKQHGTEPSDISSYYTVSNAELEHYRRVIYAEQMTSGDGDGGGGETHDYSRDYLTFEAIQNTTFTFTTNALQYSLDNGSTWTTLAANTASPTVTAGNKIMWKQTGLTPTALGIGTFSATGNFKAYGNIMSLYYGDNFIGQIDLTGNPYAFHKLFFENTYLIDASDLILPATTLANFCYQYMFCGCTSLTTAPELPATTLTKQCYASMFDGCTSLSSITCLATSFGLMSTSSWTSNVAESGTFTKASGMEGWTINGEFDGDGIPSGWTVQDAA